MLEKLNRNGFVLLSCNTNQSILDVAESIGKIYKVSTMPLIQTLTPRLKDINLKNTYSGNFGIEEFPFHTDLAHWYVPPRYIMLMCVIPAEDVDTKLIDSRVLCNKVEASLFSRAHFKPRKRLDRAAIILKLSEGNLFRWDSMFLNAVNKPAEQLSRLINNRLNEIESLNFNLSHKGDCLLIDNWRMLHARSAVNQNSMHRKIERVYFEEVII